MGFGSDVTCWAASTIELVDQEIDAERYWPRPIPVSERLPEDGVRAQWFICNGNRPRWSYGVFRKWRQEPHPDDPLAATFPDTVTIEQEYFGQNTNIVCAMDTFSHWLPMPPKPE